MVTRRVALVVVSVVALLAALLPSMAGALIAGLIGMAMLAMTCTTVVAGLLDELHYHRWRLRAAERLLLPRVGRAYEFIHLRLQRPSRDGL
jgi:hypothetical protein